MYIEKYNKIINILIITILLLISLNTIAYSAISSTMKVTGTAYAKIESDIRITKFKISNLSSGAISSYEEFSRKTITSSITLPTTSSYITYELEVTNYGANPNAILEITGLSSSLTYELSNYTLKEKICDETSKCSLGAKKKFYITIKPKNQAVSNHQLQLTINFQEYNTITYNNIDSTNKPTEVLHGDNLEINFGDNAPNGVVVTMGEAQIDYYYENGILLVNNVTGDIIISDMSNYDLSGNNNTAIFANTTISDEGIVFDGISSSARLPDNTNVSLPATYSFKFKTNQVAHQIIFGDRTTNAGFGTYSNNGQYIATIGGTDDDAPTFYHNTEIGVFYQIDILYETLQNIRLFVNGVEITSRGSPNRWDWENDESYIGRRGYSATLGNTYFDGVIEKFMIYDDLLTEEEILYNYNSTNPNDVVKDNLKLYYYFK